MSDLVKRNWWVPGPIALIGSGIVFGLVSHAERVDTGGEPWVLQIAGEVALTGLVFVAFAHLGPPRAPLTPGMDPGDAGPGDHRQSVPLAVAG